MTHATRPSGSTPANGRREGLAATRSRWTTADGRLEEAGLVTVEWRAGDGGPGRKFYSLTAAGREEHVRQATDWLTFTDITTTFIRSALAGPIRKDPS